MGFFNGYLRNSLGAIDLLTEPLPEEIALANDTIEFFTELEKRPSAVLGAVGGHRPHKRLSQLLQKASGRLRRHAHLERRLRRR